VRGCEGREESEPTCAIRSLADAALARPPAAAAAAALPKQAPSSRSRSRSSAPLGTHGGSACWPWLCRGDHCEVLPRLGFPYRFLIPKQLGFGIK
jgi:hypothetical protein